MNPPVSRDSDMIAGLTRHTWRRIGGVVTDAIGAGSEAAYIITFQSPRRIAHARQALGLAPVPRSVEKMTIFVGGAAGRGRVCVFLESKARRQESAGPTVGSVAAICTALVLLVLIAHGIIGAFGVGLAGGAR